MHQKQKERNQMQMNEIDAIKWLNSLRFSASGPSEANAFDSIAQAFCMPHAIGCKATGPRPNGH